MTQGENTYWTRGFRFGLPAGMGLCFALAGLISIPELPDDSLVSETSSFGAHPRLKSLTVKRAPNVSSAFYMTGKKRRIHVDSVATFPRELTPGTPAYRAWVLEVCQDNGINVTRQELLAGDYWNRRLRK